MHSGAAVDGDCVALREAEGRCEQKQGAGQEHGFHWDYPPFLRLRDVRGGGADSQTTAWEGESLAGVCRLTTVGYETG